MQVNLLAMGGGTTDTLSEAAHRALLQAQQIVGASRLLEQLPEGCTKNRMAATKPQQILEALQSVPCEQAAVVYSGDTGFYSGCRNLVPMLEAQDISYTIYPGISSVQLLAAALHRPWQDWLLVSAHGVQCDVVSAVMQGRPVFFLTGGSLGVPQLCAQLVKAGLRQLKVTVGEDLSYPEQRITTGTAQEIEGKPFSPLSVLLTEAIQPCPQRAPGWPDDWFVRGKVPMTKQFVRAAILATLAPKPGETIWDVGAGTGSVSVELAAAVQGGPVYAVECEETALSLIEQNRAKFRTWNLHPVAGRAPQVLADLPAPDAVFLGGSKGAIEPIIRQVLAKNPKARLCVSCIALETLQALLHFCQEQNLQPQVVQLAVSQAQPAGGLHLMMAQNPIYLVSVQCNDELYDCRAAIRRR